MQLYVMCLAVSIGYLTRPAAPHHGRRALTASFTGTVGWIGLRAADLWQIDAEYGPRAAGIAVAEGLTRWALFGTAISVLVHLAAHYEPSRLWDGQRTDY